MIKSEKEIPFLSIFVCVDHVQCEKKELDISQWSEIVSDYIWFVSESYRDIYSISGIVQIQMKNLFETIV